MSELQKAVRHPLRSFSVAFRFLTIFPFWSLAGDDTDYFGAARYYFALVGLVVCDAVERAGFRREHHVVPRPAGAEYAEPAAGEVLRA